MVYLVGSLRNPQVPLMAKRLRESGFEVFDDWYAAGPGADDAWRDYERAKGHTLPQALKGAAGQNVFQFDRRHLVDATSVVLLLPAGKSAHLELGWAIGKNKHSAVFLGDEPDRYDVMYAFASLVTPELDELVKWLEMNGEKDTP